MFSHYLFLATVFYGLSLGASSAEEEQPAKTQTKPDELAAKLIRNTVNQSTSEDPMIAIVREMSEVAERLQVDFDPGEQTQAQQQQVSAKLDEAIKAAAARRRAQSQSDPKQSADKRTMSATKKQEARKTERKQAEGEAKSPAEKIAEHETAAKHEAKSDAPNTRRTWGNLPQRDREEFLQGAEEQSLERFRPWIDQYFRALQESNR
jgi:hypothetical protein